MASIIIRPATEQDIPSMLSVYFSAFSPSLFSQRCFPSSSPDVQAWQADKLRSQIGAARGNHVLIAESDSGSVLGWARWVRRPAAPSTKTILSESDYPSSGDRALAVRLFQANADATCKHTMGESHWFLSTIATAREAQRRGVGSALMQFGVDKADEEGWMAYLNSSPEGKGLYEKFGFRVVDESEIPELDIVQYHMKRVARNKSS
ncbi:hypothetical protein N0V84_002690 [Fusarium piperis]|uniref:N-acetyltransferase domain-containing protein n=1 Tax=Fusarium piperis TaxID=1435070 RepID=A0A9W9BRU4_9HYPO|nr:hypothetical protein N0V84_002690 [Fusarium piperis]